MSAELMYLGVVLAAALVTAYWAGHRVGLDLSFIQSGASILGLDEATAGAPPAVGYTPTTPAYCNPGQDATFANGMAALKRQVGDAMGTPTECEHSASAAGDTLQQTTTGLATYTRTTNTDAFTDGWHHWALTPDGLVTWDGNETNPPPPAASG